MIRVQKKADLGSGNYGWLKARYHFSFANYVNRSRMGFGVLRVVNDDVISAGRGFAPHSHRDMEIITYVRSGAVSHEDSLGNKGKTAAGDIQVMSAGTGITHGEYNCEAEDTTLYQIWIEPAETGVEPRWDTRPFPKDMVSGGLPLLASGRESHAETDALRIHQDAALYGGRVAAGDSVRQVLEPGRRAYILASDGAFTVNGVAMEKGDGAEIDGETEIDVVAETEAEIVVIDLP